MSETVISSRALVALPVCITLPVISISTLGISIYAQRCRGNRLFVETWILVAAWLVSVGVAASTTIHAMSGELGRNGTDIPALFLADAPRRFSQQILTATAIQLVRSAVLLLYRRVFATNRFRLLFNVVFGVSWLHCLSVIGGCTALFIFHPTDRTAPINTRAYFLGNATASLVLDIVTLCMPYSAIRRLQMSPRKKLGLVFIFGLGGICVLASVLRVVYFVKFLKIRNLGQAGSVIFNINVWSVVEPFMSIVAACLPTCATSFRKRKQKVPLKEIGSDSELSATRDIN